jgi:hypothetical protein
MKKVVKILLPLLLLFSLSACVVENDHDRIVTVTNQMGKSIVVSINTFESDEPTTVIPPHASVDFITNDNMFQVLHYKIYGYTTPVYDVDIDLHAYHSYIDVLGSGGDIDITD